MFRNELRQMLQTIEAEVRLTAPETGRSFLDPRVLRAMGRVRREAFLPEVLKSRAYANHALPIGEGQTISQPFIVALMTDLLAPRPGDEVLEVGTGSGYQAAVLSLLVKQVYSVEIVTPLARAAQLRLQRLGYANVLVREGDGYHGWPEHAPFDGIIVTAAVSHIPRPLVAQLRPGGCLVLPVGLPDMPQELMVVEKNSDGRIHSHRVLGVAFVPLTGTGARGGGGEGGR